MEFCIVVIAVCVVSIISIICDTVKEIKKNNNKK